MATKKEKVLALLPAVIDISSRVNVEEFLTISQFLDTVKPMTKAMRYYYMNNNKTTDMRTKEDWIIITKLK